MNIDLFILFVSQASYGIPAIALLLRVKRHSALFNWLTFCLMYSFVSELLSDFLFFYLKVNPNYGGNQYALFSTIPISFFFYYAIQRPSLKPMFAIIGSVVFLATGLFLSINGFAATFLHDWAQALMIIAYCIIFFYRLLKDLPTVQLQSYPLFWVIAGWFFGYSGKLVVYAASQYFVKISAQTGLTWIMHNTLTILGNVIIMYGIYLHIKSMKSGAKEPRVL